MTDRNPRIGMLCALTAAGMWGVLPFFLKITLKEMDPWTVTWFRFSIAFVALGLYLLRKHRLPRIRSWSKAQLWLFLTAAVFLAGNYILYLVGLHETAPTNAQVLIQAGPMFLGMGGLVLFGERYRWRQWVGVSILVLGFYLFSRDQMDTLIETRGVYMHGSAMILLAALSWGIYALAQRPLSRQLGAEGVIFGVFGVCTLLFAPMANLRAVIDGSPLALLCLLFCGLNTCIAYLAFAASLHHWAASRVSAVLAINPILTLACGWGVEAIWPGLINPEIVHAMGITGAVLVVAGSLITALTK